MSAAPRRARVLILGAGPAGLAAAHALTAAGIDDIAVLEREAQPGGIPRHTGHGGYGWREFRRWLDGPSYARRLVVATPAPILTQTSAVALHPEGRVETLHPERGHEVWQAETVLLALGARETPRAARLVGGSRPWGVTTTGALQQFVYLQRHRPFERAVVVGSELVAFSALLTLRHGGMRAVAMLEPGPRIVARRPADWLARSLFGAPVLTEARIAAIQGTARVAGVVVERRGERREIACDGVVFTGGFRPETAIVVPSHLELDPGSGGPAIDQFWRCSDPSYFAAGNLLRGIETAGRCWAEGRAAAQAIAWQLSGRLPRPQLRQPIVAPAPLLYAYPQRWATPAPALPLSPLLFHGRVAAAQGRFLPERRIVLTPPGADLRYSLERR